MKDEVLSGEAESMEHCTNEELSYSTRKQGLVIGETMPDGSIYAGLSSDTGRPLFTTGEAGPEKMMWGRAMEYAANLLAHGRNDWRLPTAAELNVLYENRQAIGKFDVSGAWYWASCQSKVGFARIQRFNDGAQGHNNVYDTWCASFAG